MVPSSQRGKGKAKSKEAPGSLKFSRLGGIDEVLLARPFGRKGEFSATRQFGVGTLPFHLGKKPVELLGIGVDADASFLYR